MTAQARLPTKATFMPFLCYWATLIKIFKNTYLLVGEILQAPERLYKRKSFCLCGKQNFNVRGHRDDSTSTASNKSNFHAILMLLGNSDKNLQEHLLTGRRNPTST